jgi:molecular chaperone DnaK (HSP70)
MADQVFGIDLGTTYSAIAHINDFDQPEVIRNREGEETTPSVVYFESETNFVVGKEAKNEILLNPDSTVALIKRHMGTTFSRDFFGKEYHPETISALILKDLVDYARENTGVDTNKVVITVPAYFGLAEKEATRQAGEIAGLEVVGIVTEPVAAALSVGITGEQEKILFVYDLGGGTFDCTVMRLAPGKIEVIVIDGDRVLGGADWDAKLFELLNAKFMAQAGLTDDPTADEDFAQKLMTMVEETKKTLSRKDRTTLTLSHGDANERVEVTRAEFEEATRTLVDLTIEIVKRTMAAAQEKYPGLTPDDVLLVGGSGRMPMIEASLQTEMGWTLHKTELDLAVAKGAAIYGQGTVAFEEVAEGSGAAAGSRDAAPAGDGEKHLILGGSTVEVQNVLSRSLGVQLVRENSATPGGWDNYVGFLAHANDSLPLDTTMEAATASHGTTELGIHIFEQSSVVEDETLASNREVTPDEGAVLGNLPSLAAGSPVHFDLHIGAEGQSVITAFEPSTNQRVRIAVSLSVMQAADVAAAKQLVSGMIRRD